MIYELIWDTELFGRKIGKLDGISADEELKKILAQATEEDFKYITCRVNASEIHTIQNLEKVGFYLTDVGVVFERNVKPIEKPKIIAKEATIEDVGTLNKISTGLFRSGRIYNDPYFTKEEADRFYQKWAENSVRSINDKVFLIDEKGFITCKPSGNIDLIGVSTNYQGKGIGTALVHNAINWFNKIGINNVTVRTQGGNSITIKFYEYLGFRIKTLDITMGKNL